MRESAPRKSEFAHAVKATLVPLSLPMADELGWNEQAHSLPQPERPSSSDGSDDDFL